MSLLQLSSTMSEELPFAHRVIHRVPGRVRLRLAAGTAQNYPKLSQTLRALPWVAHFRINPWAASVVIYYHPPQSARRYRSQNFTFQQYLDRQNPSNSQSPRVAEDADVSADQSWLATIQQSRLTLPLIAAGLGLANSYWNSFLLRSAARLTILVASFPVAQRAITSIARDHKLNIDCLDLMALILSGIQGKLITPALVITLHELGDLIRDQTARATEKKTTQLMDSIGRFAWVQREDSLAQVKSDQVRIGETVIVYPGERIPIDGLVTSGEATVDQQQLTGESMPIVAQPGTAVYASTLLHSGKLEIRCERVGAQTRAALSMALLAKAPVHDTRMANYAAQLADKLIIPSLLLAGVVYATTQDPTRAASILTLDFVTGVRISMPTAFLGALNHTTRHGLLVRSGRTLELLAEIDTVVFDKTGTLTQGDIAVASVTPWGDRSSERKTLQLAASAEQRITHPVAEAIVYSAAEQEIEILPRDEWHYHVGLGIQAAIAGQNVLVGSATFMAEQHIKAIDDVVATTNPSESVIYVAADGQLCGWLTYTDPLRPESAALVAALQRDHAMEIHVLTGDSQRRANQVGQTLGIPEKYIHGEAFPEDKACIIQNLRRSGRVVAFVGDGLNDSVALAYADVSISFADGSDIARETADVVLMTNDLSSILEAIAIAQETRALIEQNTLLVITPNMIGLGLATTTGLNPLWATIIHNGTAIAAGFNSLRPLLQHQLDTMI